VHARWIRLTSEINESIGSRCGSDCGLDSGSEEVLKVWMKKNSKGRKRMRRREAIFFFVASSACVCVFFSYVITLFLFCEILKLVLFERTEKEGT
jgi:hypothetical protein